MEPFSLAWAAECMNGQIVGAPGNESAGEITSICIDSRQAKPGALFFALHGEKSDGHAYVAQALRAGATAAVVEHKIEGIKENEGAQVVVPATLRALGDLSRHYRRQFAIPIIGITGSVGKTSTKEMIAAVLRTTYNTLANEKNYNNEIGVPLTLFNLNKTHQAAVVEMGMRGLGQIDYLAEIAEPTIGVITNIGSAHLELLGSSENIAQAKAELFARLPANGTVILPRDIAYQKILKAVIPSGCRIIEPGDTIRASEVRLMRNSVHVNSQGAASFRVRIGDAKKSLSIQLQAVGLHTVDNALLALAVSYALNIPSEQAALALSAWQGAEGRMNIRYAPNGIVIFDDCYNASPESTSSALFTLKRMSTGRVVVLGDMRELGDFAQEAHRSLGYIITDCNDIRLLVTVGEMAAWIADAAEKRRHPAVNFQSVRFSDAKEAAEHITELVQPGDTVLVKGSRAMGMEVIVEALTGEPSGNAHA